MLARFRTSAFFLVGAALALGSASCSFVSGEHEAETKFLVKPNSRSSFSGWSELTVPEDPKSVTSAELMYVRLEAQDASIPDLTFIQQVAGAAEVGETSTKVAEKTSMPAGERIVPLDLVYDGDLRGFFYDNPDEDGYTVHITWTGQVNPAYPIPADGIWMKVKLAVRIDD